MLMILSLSSEALQHFLDNLHEYYSLVFGSKYKKKHK